MHEHSVTGFHRLDEAARHAQRRRQRLQREVDQLQFQVFDVAVLVRHFKAQAGHEDVRDIMLAKRRQRTVRRVAGAEENVERQRERDLIGVEILGEIGCGGHLSIINY